MPQTPAGDATVTAIATRPVAAEAEAVAEASSAPQSRQHPHPHPSQQQQPGRSDDRQHVQSPPSSSLTPIIRTPTSASIDSLPSSSITSEKDGKEALVPQRPTTGTTDEDGHVECVEDTAAEEGDEHRQGGYTGTRFAARRPSSQELMASWIGTPSVRGGSETTQMVLLTFSAIGITFTWGIEMTYCTPYLLNLGLTKSNTSLVWIAGPLSGLIVQPIVGVIADESKSRWGRRRPLMALGTAIVAFCLMVLGFTREIVGIVESDDEKARRPTIILAVLAIYAVDFAINAVMSCSRSLIVDTLPIEKQQAGAAWFSRMSAIGHMIGYGAGAVDLPGIFGTWLGDTQFKQLTIIAIIAMISTNAITCWAVTERVLVKTQASSHKGRFKIFSQIYSTILHLPPRIKAICWAQFWSWIGWFPFLFYGTTWVGETYFRYDAPDNAEDSKDVLGDMGRIGSTSLVIYSAITFAGAFILPLLVESPEDKKFTPRPPKAISGFIDSLGNLKPTLLTTWISGHLLFSIAMAMTPFATSFRFATFLVCLCGLPWTIAMWAPVAFLGVEVNKLSGAEEGGAPSYRRLSDVSDIELSSRRNSIDMPLQLEHGPDNANGPSSSTGELSGIYFGILNIFTTLPQFVGTFISTLVFAILEPGKSPELAQHANPDEHASTGGPNAIAVCLFIGAMSTFYAAYATRKLKHL